MRKVLDVIWGVSKRKYFCKGDSTQNCPTGKSPRRREPLSCPGRAAAYFTLLRRDGTYIGTSEAGRADALDAKQEVVILRESGVSSTPQLLGSVTSASEYWIALLSRKMKAGS